MRTALILTVFALLAPSLIAEETGSTQTAAEKDTLFLLGPGVLYQRKPYKGVDDDVIAIPMVIYKSEKISIFGPRAAYSLFGEEDRWGVQALFRFRLEGYDADDSPNLTGMADRDPTLELGARYIYDFDFAVFSADFTHDILGEHEGYEFRAVMRKSFQDVLNVKSLRLTPSLGVNFRSGKLNNYYYGVSASEAVSGRPAYGADDCTNFLTGLQVDYRLADRWNLFGAVNVEWLDSEMKNSPIVDEHYIAAALFGLLCKF